ncbi:2-oxoglutarate dehydrogenase complex dihydrolipoyllysine-residue succinyltransferase [bacterium]|nr:2-oxoglutarate dehydrogenase complex dihydrolipoyllysine-residue succinyltransferase [bacterium]
MKKEIIVPAAGESVKEADLVNWYKKNGEFVRRDEPLCELETEKATLDLAAEIDGILTVNVDGGTVKVGDVVGFVTASSEVPSPVSPAPTPVSQVAPAVVDLTSVTDSYAKGHPSPAAAKLMAETGKSVIQGTGKDGRVTKADVSNAAPSVSHPQEALETVVPSPSVSIDFRTERREKMTRLRKTIMNRLIDSQQSTASLTTFNEVDMSAVMDIRKKYKDAFKEKYQVGLGFMSFFTKAVCNALLEFPLLNAYVDGDEIIFHDYCDVGIAVATQKGLVVPVIRNADQLSFHQIEGAILDFAKRGQAGKLTIQEMEGGTFTITNGGTFGSMLSTPIINRPQSAILGMHNIVSRPVVVNGDIVARPIMYLAVTYDHRIIDGSDAVRFLVRIKEQLEDPTRLLVGM